MNFNENIPGRKIGCQNYSVVPDQLLILRQRIRYCFPSAAILFRRLKVQVRPPSKMDNMDDFVSTKGAAATEYFTPVGDSC